MANEAVKAMINQLHARLKDVEKVVDSCPIELSGYDKRLDRVDDQVYLLQVEMEKLAVAANRAAAGASVGADAAAGEDSAAAASEPQAAAETGVAAAAGTEANGPAAAEQGGEQAAEQSAESLPASEASKADESTKIGPVTITPDMKADMKESARAVGEVLRDGKDIVSEITGAMGDVKEAFSFNTSSSSSRRRRRR